MHDPSRARVHEHALELVVEPHPRRPAEHGAGLAEQDDELGLADRDRAARAGPLGLAGGLVGAQRRADVERQALVDRAGDAQGRAVLAHLLDELRAEHAHAGDPLVEAQVAAAGEVGVVLRAGEREGAAPHQRVDPRARGRGRRRPLGAGVRAPWPRAAARPPGGGGTISSRAGTAWRGGFTSGDYRRRPRERSSQCPVAKPRCHSSAEARMEREERRMKPVERWVEQVAATLRPDRVAWCDGSEAENARLVDADARRRHPPPASRGEGPRLVPAPQPPLGRGPHRAPHLHRQPDARGRRAHEQLDVPRGGPAAGVAALRGRDEGADALRRPLRHGPARLALQPGRRRGHGQPLRRREHADHDPHGPGRARPAGLLRGVRARAPLARRPLARAPLHRALPGGALDLERGLGLRRQRAPRQEVLRAAHRLDHGPRPGLDGRAHAHPRARAAGRGDPLRRRRLPLRLRQDEPRHARLAVRGPRLQGAHGGRRHRLAAARPRRAALGGQPRGRLLRRRARHRARRPTRTPSPRSRATRSSRTWR